MRSPRSLSTLAFAFIVMTHAAQAAAAGFHVNPVVLSISRNNPSTQLVIENDNDEVLRFQVNVYAWDQGPTEELKLTPTETLIVFPTVFAIDPHGKRTLRVGMKQPPSGGEEAYRIIIEQLADKKTSDTPKNTGVQMLTRMSLPLFTAIDDARPVVAFSGLSLQRGLLAWDTKNTGNIHVVPRSVVVVGRDAKGATVFQEERKAWYVLRDRLHHNEVQIPEALCKKAVALELSLNGDDAKATATIPVTAKQCSGS